MDEYWEKLSAGREPNQCGWLQDKFGVSWQVVPRILGELLCDPDETKAQRVMMGDAADEENRYRAFKTGI